MVLEKGGISLMAKPKGWFTEILEVWDVISWCWREFIDKESKKIARIMVFTQVASGIVVMVKVWSVSLVFNALVLMRSDFQSGFAGLINGLLLFLFLSTVVTYLNLRVKQKRERLMSVNTGYVESRIREMFFDHSLGIHISEDTNLNEANIRKGKEYLSKVQNIFLYQGLDALIYFLMPFGAVMILSYYVGSISMFVAPWILATIFIGYSLYLHRSIVIDAGPIDEDWRAYNRYTIERFREPERVKNSAKESYELKRCNEIYDGIAKRDLSYWSWFILRSSDREAICEHYANFAFCFGALQVAFGNMSLGLLSPVWSWSWRLVDGLWRIAEVEFQIDKSIPSIMAMKKALTLPVGIHIPSSPVILPKKSPLRIEFRNVSYRYENRKKDADGESVNAVPVLKDISFTIEPGEKAALIGPSGAGKTTVMRLMLRYMDPSDGVILVNGVDLKDIDVASWLQRIGYVRQQSEILSGDIYYNLVYGITEGEEVPNEEEVWRVARPLQIDFGESRLTDGLRTKVGFKGIKLSGGQAQRVMIGAAIMRNPDLLLFDEATSSLDSTTEKLVQKGVEHYLPEGRGALFNAHRLSTVRHICSKFIVLNGGDSEGSRVTAIAPNFEELAIKSDTFRKLAEDQDIVL